MDNAIAYAEKMVSCLEKLPKTDDLERKHIDARTILGLYLVQMNYHAEAKEAVDPIIDSAVKKDYKRRLGQIYQILGSYYCFVEEDLSKGIRVLEEAMTFATETQDLITYALGGFWLGYAYAYNCQFEKSFEYFQQVIDLNLASNNQWGAAAMKGNLAFFCSWSWGKCDLGLKISEEAVRLAEQSGDAFSQGISYATHGYSCFVKGYLDEAEKYLLKSVDFCERIRFKSWNGAACIGLGDLYWENKNFKKSKENFKKGFQYFEDARNVPSIANLAKVGLARAKVMGHEKDINLETLFAYSAKNRLMVYEGYYKKWISDLLSQLGGDHLSNAETWINQAIESDKRNGTNWSLGKDYRSYADLLTKKGGRLKAIENLGKPIETFKECGADGWVEKAERKLAEMA